MPNLRPQLETGIVENQTDEVWVIGGEQRCGINWVLTPDEQEQVRTGYRCIHCMGVQSRPFPRVCEEPFCDYPIADDQIRRYTVEFQGTKHYGPTDDSIFDDERERERWARKRERQGWHTKNGILVPEGALAAIERKR